ncbi:hypothetical protein V5O48_010607 [Marasmius crinis-equi]|uniref:Uncharacterized protein n=1 Tax=Marasmius crinis-equi TaxID=585013 RepID=A0ABR3F7X2_9AGAR
MSHQKISRDSPIVEEARNLWTWVGVATAASALILLYQYSRKFLWPCLTPLELKKALKSLEDIHRDVKKDFEEIVDREWEEIADDCLNMSIAASEINEKHLQGSSKWSKYVGINPGLMPAIAHWYAESEELKGRILKAQERNKRNNFELELYRRRNARSWHSLPGSFYVSAYENPFRYQTGDVVSSSSEGPHITNTIQQYPPTSRSDEIVPGVNSRQAPNNFTSRARRTWHLNDGATSNDVTM